MFCRDLYASRTHADKGQFACAKALQSTTSQMFDVCLHLHVAI
jgi:hypothetical protein